MKSFFVYISFFCICLSYSQQSNDALHFTPKNTYIAGETIQLYFKNIDLKSTLTIKSTFGTTVLSPIKSKEKIVFIIPKHIGNQSGLVYWMLHSKGQKTKGNFTIVAKEKSKTLETYLGPPSIIAGGKDFSMMVVIPTDNLDNPLKEGTTVNFKQRFKNSTTLDSIATKNLIAYKNFYSPTEKGKLIVSTESKRLNSNEYEVLVRPSNATNFTLSYEQNHNFADGNQITTIKTSVIKDSFNNIISDGTYVNFLITNKEGNTLKTSGTTINGVAVGTLIHPDEEDIWRVKGFIEGIAESSSIEIKFLSAVKSFNVTFENNNRFITIGPIQSFMNQNIPDGFKVTMNILKNNTILKTIEKPSRKGFVTFTIDQNLYENGIYDFEIKTAGILKRFEKKQL